MVMLKGKIYDFGDKPLPTHLRSMGDELEELAFINGEDENIDEIGALPEAARERARRCERDRRRRQR